MKMDIDARLLSAVKTSKDEMVLTLQVRRPSINYTVGQPYTVGESLFEAARRAGRRTAAQGATASQAGRTAAKAGRRGRPTNKERIRRYITEHGGTAEHAAKALHIKQ